MAHKGRKMLFFSCLNPTDVLMSEQAVGAPYHKTATEFLHYCCISPTGTFSVPYAPPEPLLPGL